MSVPPSLLELQSWFAKLATRPLRKSGKFKIPVYPKALKDEIGTKIAPGPHLSSEERMGIYNQQYWWRLFTLMQDHYPGLARLVGPGGFNRLIAEPYLLKYPSDDWSLSTLGSRLPRWIEEEYHEEDKSLLFQMALLDEAHERLPYAHSLPPLTPQDAEKTLYLQPWIALFHFDADIPAFRDQLLAQPLDHWEKNDFPTLIWEAKYLALIFQSGTFSYETLSPAAFSLLYAFSRGSTIEEACAQLDNAPQIGSWFQTWAEHGWLTAK